MQAMRVAATTTFDSEFPLCSAAGHCLKKKAGEEVTVNQTSEFYIYMCVYIFLKGPT